MHWIYSACSWTAELHKKGEGGKLCAREQPFTAALHGVSAYLLSAGSLSVVESGSVQRGSSTDDEASLVVVAQIVGVALPVAGISLET